MPCFRECPRGAAHRVGFAPLVAHHHEVDRIPGPRDRCIQRVHGDFDVAVGAPHPPQVCTHDAILGEPAPPRSRAQRDVLGDDLVQVVERQVHQQHLVNARRGLEGDDLARAGGAHDRDQQRTDVGADEDHARGRREQARKHRDTRPAIFAASQQVTGDVGVLRIDDERAVLRGGDDANAVVVEEAVSKAVAEAFG